ncbi:MAG: FAD-dependent oxidoreductase, partial [Gammaproteobacteria bacterium]
MSEQPSFDIVIIGAGIVGLTLACALANTRFNVAIIDAQEPGDIKPDDDYELRVSAISRASQQVFMNVHAWEGMRQRRISPFEHMHVWDATG